MATTSGTNERKDQLYQELVTDVNNEFKNAGDQLVQEYGKTTTTKMAIETFNNTVSSEVTKKMKNVKSKNPEQVQKQYKSLSKSILKQAKKIDTLVKNYGRVLGASPVGGNVLKIMEGALKTGQELVDKYGEKIDRFDHKQSQSGGWLSKIKKMLPCLN